MSEDAVSAVIPVHNGATFLADAIESVLSQTHPVLECVVVDDGSTDATAEVVARFNNHVRYIPIQRGGVSRARNLGTSLAEGEFIAFLDHDDLWLPGKLERQLEVMRAHPKAKLVLCAHELMDASGTRLGLRRLSWTSNEDLVNRMLMFCGTTAVGLSSNALIRRDWLLRSGGFDPRLSTSADWDLQLRAAIDGGIVYVDDPLMRCRVHGANMSHDVSLTEHDMRRAFAKAFANPRLPESARLRRRRAYGRLFRMLTGSYHASHDWRAAGRTAAIACYYNPAFALEVIARVSARPRSAAGKVRLR